MEKERRQKFQEGLEREVRMMELVAVVVVKRFHLSMDLKVLVRLFSPEVEVEEVERNS